MISLMKKQASDKFFNVILNSIADGVFTTDSEGKITFFNKAAEEITGFTSKEALGRFCFDVFRADICQSRCALKETIRTKKEIINLPVTVLNKKGKKLPISISTANSPVYRRLSPATPFTSTRSLRHRKLSYRIRRAPFNAWKITGRAKAHSMKINTGSW